MSTSIHSGIVEFADSYYGTDDDPVDTVLMRDGVANGLLHAADSMGQMRVNVMCVDSGVSNGQSEYFAIDTPDPTIGQWYHMGGSPFGEWPLTIRQTGTPYRLRIRMAGYVDGGGGAATATYQVVIAPTYEEAVSAIDRSVDYVWQATTTSTTNGWLTGATLDSSNATYLDVPASVAGRAPWLATPSIWDAVSDGEPTTPINGQVLVSAWVFAKSSTAQDAPRMTALQLQEFIAP